MRIDRDAGEREMTRDEFIDVCVQGGYCNRAVATMYVKKTNKET